MTTAPDKPMIVCPLEVDGIPDELKGRPIWSPWRFELNAKTGKWGKVPIKPVDDGYSDYASANNPRHRWTFDKCLRLVGYGADGLGLFVGDGVAAIDLDNAFDELGDARPWAYHLVKRFKTYSEKSPGGNGLHVVLYTDAELPNRDLNIPDGGKTQFFGSNHYITITGARTACERWLMADARYCSERTAELQEWYAETFPAQPATAAGNDFHRAGGDLADDELLAVAFRAKNGTAIQALWEGHWQGKYPSQSEADLALCDSLAYYTGKDASRMRRMFERSALYRPGLDAKLGRTIQTACDNTPNVYIGRTQDYIDAIAAAESAVGLNSKGAAHRKGDGHLQGGATVGNSDAAQSQAPSIAPQNPQTADYIRSLHSLGYDFRLNELDDTVEVNRCPITEVVAAEMRSRMRDLGYGPRHITAMEDAVLAYAGQHSYHPIRDYLRGLQWDGRDHIRALTDRLTDKHTPIVYADGTAERVIHIWFMRWLLGAVAKICKTGTLKAQNVVLALDARQGAGKSTLASWLCSGMPSHFVEGPVDPESTEHARYLAGKWIWEIGELGSTVRKADRESLKRFLTQTTVTFRIPYARHSVTKPAMASFIGTVNSEGGFLQDATGTRRFLSVGLTKIDWGYLAAVDVNQVWAQAYALYLAGEPWQLLPEEVQKRGELNGEYEVADPYEGWVHMCFDLDAEAGQNQVTGWFTPTHEITAELQRMGVRGETRAIQMALATTMKRLGLEKDRYPKRGGSTGYWGIRIKSNGVNVHRPHRPVTDLAGQS